MYGQKTGRNRDHEQFGIRGLARPLDSEKWRIPTGPPIVEDWIERMRKYTPFDHPADTIVAAWLAWSRLKGRGARLALGGEKRMTCIVGIEHKTVRAPFHVIGQEKAL